ncbi:MoaD/ThiS family protein [Tessaracoccus sp. MC1756]|uniref:MoaD/ThiS family protein n=1 Tax=Tessaracoccus sp. MC1756 TaxID=2760311 RepID=UPI0016010A70|nr:MoaD/ThiS family protein [Tessaracoccus sp. MC1756]
MEVRFFAGAAEAAGADNRIIDARGLTADQVVDQLAEGNERLAKVLNVSALLADGTRITDRGIDLSEVRSLDVLPPFAGG